MKLILTKTKAFTLIELLVVVAIIGILAAVGVVAIMGIPVQQKKTPPKQTTQQFVDIFQQKLKDVILEKFQYLIII